MIIEAPGDCFGHLNVKEMGGHLGGLHCYMLTKWLHSKATGRLVEGVAWSHFGSEVCGSPGP